MKKSKITLKVSCKNKVPPTTLKDIPDGSYFKFINKMEFYTTDLLCLTYGGKYHMVDDPSSVGSASAYEDKAVDIYDVDITYSKTH